MSKKLLMIPGPTEFGEEVYRAMAEPTLSHTSPAFIERFGALLDQLVVVGGSPEHAPVVVAAGGALGWDMVAANLVDAAAGDAAVVVSTGYFSDRFGQVLESYGAAVHYVRYAAPGAAPSAADLSAKLRELAAGGARVALVALTHVDTSTGVLLDVGSYAAAAKQAAPDALVAVDGVCATGAERTPLAHVDALVTGSQKALGAPPGLSISWWSPAAVARRLARARVAGKYADLAEWLPIMAAYRERRPSYFSTPAVNTVCALHAAVAALVEYGVDRHVDVHTAVAARFKRAVAAAGLRTLPLDAALEAHTMTAIYLPQGVELPKLLAAIAAHGVVVAGGLLPEIKTTYFRVGHMGVSARGEGVSGRADVRTTLLAIVDALAENGYSCDRAAVVAAFDQA